MVGETVGQSVSRSARNSSDEVSSPSNQASSAPSRPEERKADRASLTRRARSARRPDLYGPGRARMEETRSLIRSRLSVARANRTRRLTSSSRGRRRPWSARRSTSPIRGVRLDPADLHRLRDAHPRLGGDVADGRLHDRLFTQRGQDLRDVAQEGPARAQHQHALAAQLGVVVEQEGRPVQADGRLAGTGPALHREELVERRPDDLVLLGLNGGDDVEHLAGTGPLELRQQGVTATEPGARVLVAGNAEEVVGDGNDRPPVDHDLASPGQAEGVLGAGPIEGHGHRGTPVDDHGVRSGVLHVATADVPGRAVLFVDAPEEAGAAGSPPGATPGARVRRRNRDRGSQRRSDPATALRRAAAWPPARRGRGRAPPARPRSRDRTGEWPRSSRAALRQNTRKSARAKVPGHSGDTTSFRPLQQAPQQGISPSRPLEL